MKTQFALRRCLAAVFAAAVATSAFAGVFTSRVGNVQLSHTLLYTNQELILSYELSGTAIGTTGLSGVAVELLKSGSPVKTYNFAPGAPGTLPGANVVRLPLADVPAGGPYEVRVKTAGAITLADYTRVSDPGDPNVQFVSVRGLDVNRNVGSAAYGRIYVTEGTGGPTKGRNVVDGVYVLNPDLTPTFPTVMLPAATAGWTGSTHSPFRVYIGPDSTVWLTDAADAHPMVYFADPDLTTITPLFATPPSGGTKKSDGLILDAGNAEVFGDTTSIWIEGSGATRKVYCAIQEIQPRDSVFMYEIPEGESMVSQVPTLVADPPVSGSTVWYNDFVRDSAGNTYVVNISTPQAWKFDSTGALVATLEIGSGSAGICIDEAKDVILLCTQDGRVMKTNKEFATAEPLLTGLGAINRDVAVDGEGWIYVANETDHALHVFAPAGTYTVVPGTATAAQTLTVGAQPPAGDIAPVSPAGLYVGPTGQRYGDGKVDLADAAWSLRVFAGLNTLP
jgi:streptogramin lyase